MTDLSEQKIKSFRLHQGKTSLKQIGLVLAVALFFIGLVWLGGWGVNREIDDHKQDNVSLNGNNETKNIITPQITQAPEGELPEGFPDTIPLEEKIKITESYSATYPNATAKQATVVFESSKTPKENYDVYKRWAEKNEWQIINSLDRENLKSVYLRKGNEDINITISNKNLTISHVEF